jgi:hypothetical protein
LNSRIAANPVITSANYFIREPAALGGAVRGVRGRADLDSVHLAEVERLEAHDRTSRGSRSTSSSLVM